MDWNTEFFSNFNANPTISTIDLGALTDSPSLVKIKPLTANEGSNYYIIGNGPGSDSGAAKLFIIGYPAGDIYQEVSIPISTGAANGITTHVVIDINTDGYADWIYVGDVHGNIWKLVLNQSTGKFQFGESQQSQSSPMFTTQSDDVSNSQPILSSIEVCRLPYSPNSLMLFFASGNWQTDDQRSEVHSLYAIVDHSTNSHSSTSTLNRSKLIRQTIVEEISIDEPKRGILHTPVNLVTDNGWFIDFPSTNEQVSGDLILIGNTLLVTTHIPLDDTHDGWILHLDAKTGDSSKEFKFDLDTDDILDGKTTIVIDGEEKPTIGIALPESPEGPIVIEEVEQLEYLFDQSVVKLTDSVHTERSGRLTDTMTRNSWRKIR